MKDEVDLLLSLITELRFNQDYWEKVPDVRARKAGTGPRVSAPKALPAVDM